MKRLFVALTVLALLIGFQPAVEAATWNIDASHSTVGFKVRHFFSKVSGNFTDYQGTIDFDPQNLEALSTNIEIQAASINTDHEKRDGHLRSPDFFSVEEFPTITFASNGFGKNDDGDWILDGTLTMRGVEKPVSLEVEFLGSGPNAWGGTTAGFTARGKLNRKDFGIEWNKVLDTGGTMLSDEIELMIDIEAIQAKEEAGE